MIHLEIPISIYTPIDANKDKLGIYFHGGGKIKKINNINSMNVFIKHHIGWVIGSRKSHQATVNYLAE